MTVSTPSSNLGRHVFGVAALAFGLITLAWHDYNDSHQLRYIVYAAAAALIFGGAAIQFRRTAKTGAAILGAAYLVFTLLCMPGIVAQPQIYNSWGNFFEQFSLLTGAAIVYARLSSAWSGETRNRIGRILLGICAASFALE
jgi:peptidoglycan/LPS O-acetylase OafA/YrhL